MVRLIIIILINCVNIVSTPKMLGNPIPEITETFMAAIKYFVVSVNLFSVQRDKHHLCFDSIIEVATKTVRKKMPLLKHANNSTPFRSTFKLRN